MILPIENAEAVKVFFNKQPLIFVSIVQLILPLIKLKMKKKKHFLLMQMRQDFLRRPVMIIRTKLIHISTDYVYDGNSLPLKEEDAVAPVNVYGASKLKGEELVLRNYPSALIIRTSWVYSVYGNNFVKTMLRLFKEKESINVLTINMDVLLMRQTWLR